MAETQPVRIDYKQYLDERKELYKYQQANYDSFERTLVALCGSFLAFSIGFLGFLSKGHNASHPVIAPDSAPFLVATWVALSLSLAVLVLCFFVNVRAYTREIKILEEALDNAQALEGPNRWRTLSQGLYWISTIAFFVGLVCLILFCNRNFSI